MQRVAVDAGFSVHDEHAIRRLFRGAFQSVTQSLPSPPAFRVSDPRALFVPAHPSAFDQPSPFHRALITPRRTSLLGNVGGRLFRSASTASLKSADRTVTAS